MIGFVIISISIGCTLDGIDFLSPFPLP